MDPNSRNMTGQIVRRVQKMIESSGLAPGEIFATEAELQEKLGVSRTVLREAISRLRALGMLESRQGVGLIISKPDPVSLFKQAFNSRLMDSLDLQQLAELRYMLEVGAAEFVVLRASEDQLDRLVELAKEFTEHVSKECSTRGIDIEVEFHRTILEATQNPIIGMHGVITSYFARKPSHQGHIDDRDVWEHRAIAEALKERNAELARALLASHLRQLLSHKSYQAQHSSERRDKRDRSTRT